MPCPRRAPNRPEPIPGPTWCSVPRGAGATCSDLFPPAEAVIGRASSNQIVIRTDQASRRHARIHWGGSQWAIEDMGSRNGTFVNGTRLEQTRFLDDGDVIEVGGYAITFARRIDGGLGEPVVSTQSSQATDDQITMEIDATAITDRRRRSRYLHEPVAATASSSGVSGALLQLAFSLARCDETEVAVDLALDFIGRQVQYDTAGVYAWDAAKPPTALSDVPLMATRQSGDRSYRRPPDALVQSLAGEDGQAVLARNVVGDQQLATENSRGEIDVESVIAAPLRDSSGMLRGMIHLTTTSGATPLSGEELEFAVAVAEILAESLASLSDRKRLSRSLRRTRRQIEQLQQQLGDKVRIVGRSPAITEVVRANLSGRTDQRDRVGARRIGSGKRTGRRGACIMPVPEKTDRSFV